MIYARRFYVRTNVKITRQWTSTVIQGHFLKLGRLGGSADLADEPPTRRPADPLKYIPILFFKTLYSPKYNRGNVWKVARARRSWTSLNFYTWTFIHCFCFIYARRFDVRTHVKITRQWTSTVIQGQFLKLGRLGGSADLADEPPTRRPAKIYTNLVL